MVSGTITINTAENKAAIVHWRNSNLMKNKMGNYKRKKTEKIIVWPASFLVAGRQAIENNQTQSHPEIANWHRCLDIKLR